LKGNSARAPTVPSDVHSLGSRNSIVFTQRALQQPRGRELEAAEMVRVASRPNAVSWFSRDARWAPLHRAICSPRLASSSAHYSSRHARFAGGPPAPRGARPHAADAAVQNGDVARGCAQADPLSSRRPG
jgi:hypothetical protein